MASAVEWADVTEQIRRDGDVWSSPAVVRLWAFAEQDGPYFLRSFERSLGTAKVLDMIRDYMAEHTADIVHARTSPKALFRQAIQNYARTQLRKRSTAVADEVEGSAHEPSAELEYADPAIRALRTVFDRLSPRDQEIVTAVCYDERDRESFASTHGVRRANVDQIIARFRKALARELAR